MRGIDHIRDDENREYIADLNITRCGLSIDDEEEIAYSVPSSRVVTEATAKRRVEKKGGMVRTANICLRCWKSCQ